MDQTGRKDQRKVSVSSSVSLNLGQTPREDGVPMGEEEEEAEGSLILKITATTCLQYRYIKLPRIPQFSLKYVTDMKVHKINWNSKISKICVINNNQSNVH